jgi:hypothetical protein
MGESLRPGSLRTRKEYARRINAALDYLDRNLGETGGTSKNPRSIFDLYIPVKPL